MPLDRKDRPDAIWHVTSRVNWRVWHLKPEQAHAAFQEELRKSLARYDMELLSNAIMSNHFHLTMRSPAEEAFRRLTGRMTGCRHFRPWPRHHPKSSVVGQCMHDLKLAVAKRIQDDLGLTGHFWQGIHYRRRLVDPWALVVAIAYDHRNPVRAGMVARPEEYERSSAAWWRWGTPSPLPLATREDFPFGMSRAGFRECLLSFQEHKRLDDVMRVFHKSRLPIDSPRGREYLERLMRDAGLDPLGSRAAPGRRRA